MWKHIAVGGVCCLASFAVCALCSLHHRFCGMFNIFPLHMTIPKIKRKGSVPLKTGENKLQFVCVIQRHRQSKRKMISEEQAVSAQFTQRNDGPHNPLWQSISGRFVAQKGHSFHNSSATPPAGMCFISFPIDQHRLLGSFARLPLMAN